jgi:hypothetical protein
MISPRTTGLQVLTLVPTMGGLVGPNERKREDPRIGAKVIPEILDVDSASYYWHHFVRAIVCGVLAISLQSCGGARAAQTSSSPSASGSPASEVPTRVAGESLPHLISCESWVEGTDPNGPLTQMPDAVIKRIVDGNGLPPKFYASGAVPENFCRPINGIWTFPNSQQHFYNADEDALQQQKVSSQDRAAIRAIVNRAPDADRAYIKWMYTRDGLIVFSMKPANLGISMSTGPPYRGLNKTEIVIPDNGDVGPPPPGSQIGR